MRYCWYAGTEAGWFEAAVGEATITRSPSPTRHTREHDGVTPAISQAAVLHAEICHAFILIDSITSDVANVSRMPCMLAVCDCLIVYSTFVTMKGSE